MTMLFVAIPTYNHFDYAAQAARSLFATAPADTFIGFYDDASPEWRDAKILPEPLALLFRDFPGRVASMSFAANGGLTRSWNAALWNAKDIVSRYTLLVNSDVLFTPGWFEPLVALLEKGYDVVGPVSNAPGVTAKNNVQQVASYLREYTASDDRQRLADVAAYLHEHAAGHYVESPINGFCMLAKTPTWWKYAYSEHEVFKPRNQFNSRGQVNPTPLMTLNEDEFQGRLRDAGGKTAIACDSFVFHYRSVSRGKRYCKGQGYRPGEKV